MGRGYYWYKVEPGPGFRMAVTHQPGNADTIVLDLTESVTRNIRRGDHIDLEWIDGEGATHYVTGDVNHKRLDRLRVFGWSTTLAELERLRG